MNDMKKKDQPTQAIWKDDNKLMEVNIFQDGLELNELDEITGRIIIMKIPMNILKMLFVFPKENRKSKKNLDISKNEWKKLKEAMKK